MTGKLVLAAPRSTAGPLLEVHEPLTEAFSPCFRRTETVSPG
jgi:hypothetical protein